MLLREGLSQLLSQQGFEVVGTAGDLDGLLQVVRSSRPNVAIVDVRMRTRACHKQALAERPQFGRHPRFRFVKPLRCFHGAPRRGLRCRQFGF